MAITQQQPPNSIAPIEEWSRRDRIAGWSLALCWLALLVSLVTFGAREGSYEELRSGIRAGAITEVQESSSDFADGSTGYETVDVRWRERLITRTATLTHASDERAAEDARRGGADGPVIVGSVADHLTALDQGLRVSQGERRSPSSTTYGWQGSGWLGLAYLVLLVCTLGLISGPRPWRATRWAWAWLVLLAPAVGVPAYFLFGGSTGLFRPKPPGRIWLSGGWAFLLALLLGGPASS